MGINNNDMDITIGEKVLRRKVSGGDTIEWVITTVNETYLPLIKEFPEDYRTIGQLQKENAELREGITKYFSAPGSKTMGYLSDEQIKAKDKLIELNNPPGTGNRK